MTRRRALGWLGGAGLAAVLPGCSRGAGPSPTEADPSAHSSKGADCVLTPELTEGPYYLDLKRVRRDITEGQAGTPLILRVAVVDVGDSCAPVRDAAVDVWHCNALGEYSGVEGDDETFLRGIQLTPVDGTAEFRTIYPGWYTGRAVHIHVKVHGGATDLFTGQLFFDERVTEAVYRAGPYAARGEPDVSNEADAIYGDSEGQTTLTPAREGDGYAASVTLGIRRA